MAKQNINVGATPNDRSGDSLRSAFQKINANFTELYTSLGLDVAPLNLGAFEFTGSTLSTTDSSSITIDQATTITSNLTVGGDIVPTTNLSVNLGSPTRKFHSLYVGTGSVYIGDAKLSLEGGTLNSSVGFSTDNLTVGGVNITVNEEGALLSSGGFVGAVAGAVNWVNILNKPAIPADVSDLTDSTNLLQTSSVVNGAYNITLDTTGDFVPSTDNLQDLGSPANRFRHLYVGPGSVYIGNNVITEAATGGLVLPGFTRATGYYADEVDDDDDWGSNPVITGTITVIDASRYRILAGRPASANYSPATYTVQKDGNRIDEINVTSGGSGWDKVEADYARDNNMYATNVVGAINNFNAGNWQQIPFRVEVKAEDTEYEDIFGGGTTLPSQSGQSGKFLTTDGEDLSWADAPGGGADLGDLVIYDGAITTDGVSSIVIAPNGEGYGYVIVPNDTSAVSGAATVIGNSRNDGGGVQIAAYNKTWTFGPDGDLTLPAGGDIVNSSGQSVLGGNANTGDITFTDDEIGSTTNVVNINASDYAQLQSNNNYLWVDNQGAYVQIGSKTFEFDNRGVLRLPADGDIVNSSGQSVLGGGSNSYTPDDTDNWEDPAVNTIQAALDELAARVTALQNFEIDGGNAYTPALGELLIDGNGA